jgi:GNAT superfamily N-acetyltransferase
VRQGDRTRPRMRSWDYALGMSDQAPSPDAATRESASQLRIATLADAEAIDALMKASIRDIFPGSYDDHQTASAEQFIGAVDRTLIEDGTYFAIDADGEIVACGGWSRRDKLYTGAGEAAGDARLLDPATEPARVRAMFTRADWTRRGLGRRILVACEAAAKAEGFRTLALVATMPGLPLYQNYGFQVVDHVQVDMPDGSSIACASMTKPID